MTDERNNGRATVRELATLRDEHGRRIGNLEEQVSDHEALIQQLRGVRTVMLLVFGSSLATLALMLAALLR